MNVLYIVLLVICIEAITEILVASSIMLKPREFLAKKSSFLGELVHCGYCTSVWVSSLIAWIVPVWLFSIVPNIVVNYVIMTFVLHRLSNLFHELNSKWLNRRPFQLHVHKTETVLMPDLENKNELQ